MQDKLNSFIDGVINNTLEPKINDVTVGLLDDKVIDYLISNNINFNKEILNNKFIKLTYKGLEHILRDEKKPTQKLTISQIKRIKSIISANNVYYDTIHENIVFVGYLPKEEIEENINIIKIPVHLRKKKTLTVVTASRVSDTSIINSTKQFKKIN